MYSVYYKWPSMPRESFDGQKDYPGPFSTKEQARAWITKRVAEVGSNEAHYSIEGPEPAQPKSVATQKHYAELTPEPIAVIEGWGLSYVRGNAIKYLARAGKKDQTKEGTIKDLEKAISYIRREINALNGKAGWDA